MCPYHWLLVCSLSMKTCVQLKTKSYSTRSRSKTCLFYSVTPAFLILILAMLTFPLSALPGLLVLQYATEKQPYAPPPLFKAPFLSSHASHSFFRHLVQPIFTCLWLEESNFQKWVAALVFHQNGSNRHPKIGTINALPPSFTGTVQGTA